MNSFFSKQRFIKQNFRSISFPFPPLSSQTKSHPTRHKSLKGHRVLDLVTPKSNFTRNGRKSHLRLIQDILPSNSNNPDEHVGPSICYSHGEGLRADPRVLSHALSSCGCVRTASVGIQLHCLVIKTGYLSNVYVGSSLISFYCKCGELRYAYQVFDEMPVRNVVSWTTIIAGNVLSACTGSGCLGKGKSAHCQAIQMGFDAYVHVSNALISLYLKCGNENEAAYIFENMRIKDLVSWNSMIAGYAQHGFSSQAIDLFEEMRKKKVKPDAITFLGVLSSCRHAGLVEQGQFYFNSMVEYGLEPEVDHYSCIVDLLGRAGDLEKAWERRLELEPECAATHLQLVNLYASFGCWDQVARVRKLMKDKGLKTDPGHSWIEIRNEVYRFGAEDSLNSKTDEVLAVVNCLVDQIRDSGYACELYQIEASLGLQTEFDAVVLESLLVGFHFSLRFCYLLCHRSRDEFRGLLLLCASHQEVTVPIALFFLFLFYVFRLVHLWRVPFLALQFVSPLSSYSFSGFSEDSYNRMVVHVPFVRWDLDGDVSSTNPRAGVYYLETAQGQRVDCVAGILGKEITTFKPFNGFLQDYHNILPLSTALEWNFRCQLATWLDGIIIIYHSFLRYSEQGVDHCWSLSPVNSVDVPQRLPQGIRRYFPYNGPPTWVLLKHGCRAWPVAIVGCWFCNGWSTFHELHGLKGEFKFILTAERRWIFDTVIIDENEGEMVFDWTGPNLEPYSCGQVFRIYDIEEMVIRMADWAWTVPIDDLRLDAQIFRVFVAALQLEFLDYLLVIMLSTVEFRLLVIRKDVDTEKIYPCF
ncbi:hypothetical protein RHSIM_Rhsim04G0025800 [Rhododendron simsii]|uniref:Pentatricopeptide repeat-containing protein n=1 Tax=Rhododendron simsii TaxID=118357 RepID=A0A834LMW6_RHOSS|nr:hypothetical protein RHSIM_Rhsim04G0025800 [Rhododendron simsii]